MSDNSNSPGTEGGSGKEILEDLVEWSGRVLKRVREDVDSLSTRSRLKLRISSLKNRRGREYQALGEAVYDLLAGGTVEIPETGEVCRRIREISDEIGEKERLLREAAPADAREADAVEAMEDTEGK